MWGWVTSAVGRLVRGVGVVVWQIAVDCGGKGEGGVSWGGPFEHVRKCGSSGSLVAGLDEEPLQITPGNGFP